MDETIKHEVAEDMSEVPADYIDIDSEDFSVMDEQEPEQQKEKQAEQATLG